MTTNQTTLTAADQARAEILSTIEGKIAAMRARLETARSDQFVIEIENLYVAWKDGAVSSQAAGIMGAHIMNEGEAANLAYKARNGNGNRGMYVSLPDALRADIAKCEGMLVMIREGV